MAIRPVDVRRKEFKSGFRGYDANQVDDFLDEVADEFERTYSENRRMSDELTHLRSRLEQFEQLESAIREALVEAQQAAQDLRRNASKEAELVVREAKEQAHRILADSSARVERVQESYEVLRKAKQDFNNDFRHLLRTYSDVMERADATSAKEIESSLRTRLDTESIAVAREAAETQRIETSAPEPDIPEDSTESLEPAATAPEEGAPDDAPDDATRRLEKDPPVSEERQEEEPAGQTGTEAASEEAPERQTTQRRGGPLSPESEAAADSGAADEVDRDEPTPAGQGGPSDDFFDKERKGNEEEGQGRIFRASRFLRRRD